MKLDSAIFLPISFSFIVFKYDKMYHISNLETSISTNSDNKENLIKSINDAIISYFRTFTTDEILHNRYIRENLIPPIPNNATNLIKIKTTAIISLIDEDNMHEIVDWQYE